MLTRLGDPIQDRVFQFVAAYLGVSTQGLGPCRLNGRLESEDFWSKISKEFDWEVWTLREQVDTVSGLASLLDKKLRDFVK